MTASQALRMLRIVRAIHHKPDMVLMAVVTVVEMVMRMVMVMVMMIMMVKVVIFLCLQLGQLDAQFVLIVHSRRVVVHVVAVVIV